MNQYFKKVVILGAGGVGWYLSVALNRDLQGSGVPIEIWDGDNFKGGRGHLRLPSVSNSSRFKVEHLRDHIEWVMGDQSPEMVSLPFYESRLTEERLNGFPDYSTSLFVDCTDMGYNYRKPIWDSIKHVGAKILRVSYDGKDGTIVVSPSLPFSTSKAIEGGYSDIPTTSQSHAAGGLGAMAALVALETGKLLEFQISVNGKER